MRRFGTILAGGLLTIGLLVGPGVGSVAAGSNAGFVSNARIATAGWTCHPNGSGVVSSPATHLSLAIIFDNAPALDSITCIFTNLAQGLMSQSGGDCYYHEGGTIGIEFAHRVFIVRGATATLLCWDGAEAAG